MGRVERERGVVAVKRLHVALVLSLDLMLDEESEGEAVLAVLGLDRSRATLAFPAHAGGAGSFENRQGAALFVTLVVSLLWCYVMRSFQSWIAAMVEVAVFVGIAQLVALNLPRRVELTIGTDGILVQPASPRLDPAAPRVG
jgi:hypothetical protein